MVWPGQADHEGTCTFDLATAFRHPLMSELSCSVYYRQ